MTDFTFAHVLKKERKAAQRLIRELHYSGSDGNSGWLHTINVAGELQAACLIGGTLSKGSEKSLITPGYPCRLVKRLVAAEHCQIPESQLLRAAMRDVATKLSVPYLAISYADPVAVDARTGNPLSGALYAACGMFHIGLTSQPRYAVVDDLGALRSTRQGAITLSRKSLPRKGTLWNERLVQRDWRMVVIPPARIWVTPVVPWSGGRAWRKRQYLDFWRNLAPDRRVWAQRWINKVEWKRLLRAATVEEVDEPRQTTEHALLARATWPGDLMTRPAAPVFPRIEEQGRLFTEEDLEHEKTTGRLYWPRGEAVEL
jgi:hypothetical protein